MLMDGSSPNSKMLRLNGATRVERLACTACIREIIVAECHGWIGDFYQYSNTSLCVHFEIPAEYLSLLRDSLRAAGVNLARESVEAFSSAMAVEGKSGAISCTLQITFIHNEPDLRRHIPAIPG